MRINTFWSTDLIFQFIACILFSDFLVISIFTGRILSVTWSPNASMIYSGSSDGYVQHLCNMTVFMVAKNIIHVSLIYTISTLLKE